MEGQVNVFSEIGKLRKVFLHRPGFELEGLVPNNLQRMLFDDIPDTYGAQREHDAFAETLKQNGVEVVYFDIEFAKAIKEDMVREQFIFELLKESGVESKHVQQVICDYLMPKNVEDLIGNVLKGIKKKEVNIKQISTLVDMLSNDSPYYTDPMPALYFTRDPGACIGHGLSINCMTYPSRRREAFFLKYMHMYNRELFCDGTPLWYEYTEGHGVEGGDILVISKNTLAIGCSQRTSAQAIETMAEKILKQDSGFDKILVFEIPKCRAFMHLDTVFTMVDYDKFTIHPEIEGPLNIYAIVLDKSGNLAISCRADTLTNILAKELKTSTVQLIRCGGDDELAAQREQWNDGSNTLAVAPGVVITYDRNYVTNDLLNKCGIKVITVPSAEVSKGRGGPRCMSMPIIREDINL